MTTRPSGRRAPAASTGPLIARASASSARAVACRSARPAGGGEAVEPRHERRRRIGAAVRTRRVQRVVVEHGPQSGGHQRVGRVAVAPRQVGALRAAGIVRERPARPAPTAPARVGCDPTVERAGAHPVLAGLVDEQPLPGPDRERDWPLHRPCGTRRPDRHSGSRRPASAPSLKVVCATQLRGHCVAQLPGLAPGDAAPRATSASGERGEDERLHAHNGHGDDGRSAKSPGTTCPVASRLRMERFGLVGLPNAGKSSLYNALTGGGALAAPYAFATKDPNIGVAKVPDDRVDRLAEMSKTKTLVHAAGAGGRHRRPGRGRVARARAWATSSSPTSARSTPSCSCCGPSTTTTCTGPDDPARAPARGRDRAGPGRPRDRREAPQPGAPARRSSTRAWATSSKRCRPRTTRSARAARCTGPA